MNTILHIKKVALIFFVVTGLLHLGSTIFIANDLFLKESSILNKVMDIPFIITGMLYGLASLRLSLADPSKEHKTLDISLLSLIILTLIALIAINVFIPNL